MNTAPSTFTREQEDFITKRINMLTYELHQEVSVREHVNKLDDEEIKKLIQRIDELEKRKIDDDDLSSDSESQFGETTNPTHRKINITLNFK